MIIGVIGSIEYEPEASKQPVMSRHESVTSDFWGWDYRTPVGHEGGGFFQQNFTVTTRWVKTWFDPSWISFLRYRNILKKLGFYNTGSFALQNKGQAQLHPPHFYYRSPHTLGLCYCVTHPWTSWVSISSCLKTGVKSANGLGEVGCCTLQNG